jgi:hypothetical protein
MNRTLYFLYAIVLAGLAIFTGEIVTFILLGFILLALNNILDVLKEISRKLDLNVKSRSGQSDS